jgi:hypothetical protein
MTSPSTNPPEGVPKLTTHPYLGVAGLLLGAMVATCTGRLTSVGLVDIRGALLLRADEASWLNTSFNASMMLCCMSGDRHIYATAPTQYRPIVVSNSEAPRESDPPKGPRSL